MTVVGGAVAHGASRPSQKGGKTAFYAAAGLIGVVLLLILTATPKTAPKNYGLRTDQQVDDEIQSIQKRKDAIFREKMSQGVFNNQAGEAQAAYIQGFRDFREGNYNRAIQSFTAALALNPDHQLAQKYKRLAEKKLDELIQYNMLEGKRAFEENKFELAKAAYRNVLINLNDESNRTYKEAKERLQEVELLLKGRY
jgi:tetratricopeptide (TPR) repeat protein